MATDEKQEKQARMRAFTERRKKVERSIRMAEGHLRSAEMWLYDSKDDQYLMYQYAALLEGLIQKATEIVDHLPSSYFETEKVQDHFGIFKDFGFEPNDWNRSDDLIESIQKLREHVDERRQREKLMHRILVLENPNGRTPEEIETCQRQADEYRRQLGMEREQ